MIDHLSPGQPYHLVRNRHPFRPVGGKDNIPDSGSPDILLKMVAEAFVKMRIGLIKDEQVR